MPQAIEGNSMSHFDSSLNVERLLVVLSEDSSRNRQSLVTAYLREVLELDAAGDWPQDRWRAFLNFVASLTPGVVERALSALEEAVIELTPVEFQSGNDGSAALRLRELRAAGLIAELRENGTNGELAGRRVQLVDALMTYGEDFVKGVGSTVLHKHFARFAAPPHSLTTTLVFERAQPNLRRALNCLKLNDFTHFMRIARRHVFWRLTEWARGRLKKPVANDPREGPVAAAPSAYALPDHSAEFQVALSEVTEHLSKGDRDLLLAYYHGDGGLREIAEELYEGDEELTAAEFTRVLMGILPDIAIRLGWPPRQVVEFLRALP
jgi:hypothetical protein